MEAEMVQNHMRFCQLQVQNVGRGGAARFMLAKLFSRTPLHAPFLALALLALAVGLGVRVGNKTATLSIKVGKEPSNAGPLFSPGCSSSLR
jgi:hypothetical protein